MTHPDRLAERLTVAQIEHMVSRFLAIAEIDGIITAVTPLNRRHQEPSDAG